jgi:hypothetical protein
MPVSYFILGNIAQWPAGTVKGLLRTERQQ